jgi:hypothetical protein
MLTIRVALGTNRHTVTHMTSRRVQSVQCWNWDRQGSIPDTSRDFYLFSLQRPELHGVLLSGSKMD